MRIDRIKTGKIKSKMVRQSENHYCLQRFY
jgi:hypothetical protein